MGTGKSKEKPVRQQTRIWALDPRWIVQIQVGEEATYTIYGQDLTRIGKRERNGNGDDTYFLNVKTGILHGMNGGENPMPDLDGPQLLAMLESIESKLRTLSERLRMSYFEEIQERLPIPFSEEEDEGRESGDILED